ncbi:unnamed protein product [Parnassius apollo]|uniref:non-specific serine/threonine protein kinase n=1 Tax=Parnassius apollo TaxID=110799 RepID=A0A8S3W5L7_PARAO|nr:unnamed protein product [Parnassius apollo]
MTEKLKNYQVLDVLCDGTFYKVKHKVTNNIFAWKAYDCTAYSDEEIQNIVNEVKTISKVLSGNLLRYYDTILHNSSKTLYFVLEYNSWQSVQELISVCKATDKYFSESFIWYLLLELARACKVVESLNFAVIRKCIMPTTIYVDGSGEVCIDCFQLQTTITGSSDLMHQIGDVIHTLCYRPETGGNKIKETEFLYSDDLRDVVSFLTDERSSGLRPEVVIYHPTILSNLEINSKPKHLTEILVSSEYSHQKSELNKCDSEKFVEKCRTIKPLPRTQFNIVDSPVYSNIPKQKLNKEIEGSNLEKGSLSPSLQALALELPGYVPRCRKPYSKVIGIYNNAQRVSEETLSHLWMSRLIALREREESLNKKERELVVKEIVNSPATKLVSNEDSDICESNGVTLPPVIVSAEKNRWKSRRRRRRPDSVRARARRQSYSYEDLDSSLSADTGDGSIIVTATKFTTENMPRRNIFPDMPSKKVHFTPANPFIGIDESITLTFYELDNLDNGENQSSTQNEKTVKDITKFKYLDLENVITEKRAATQWTHSSPSKQAKVFGDITNHDSLRKTPSKSSITSGSSINSRCSMMSARSHWSMDSSSGKVSEGYVSDRTRSSVRQCFPQTPIAPPELKKTKSRKSLIHFKTPFKFKSSTKV